MSWGWARTVAVSTAVLMCAACGASEVSVHATSFDRSPIDASDDASALTVKRSPTVLTFPDLARQALDELVAPVPLEGAPTSPPASSDPADAAVSPGPSGLAAPPGAPDTPAPPELSELPGSPAEPAEPAEPVETTTTVPVLASLDQQVLSKITYPIETALAGWRIEFTNGRSGYGGSTFPGEKLIQIYVRDSSTIDDLVHVTAHEIGHALDVTYLTDDERRAFNAARWRMTDYPWWTGDGMDDFSVGSGDFAECFAVSQSSGFWNSRIGERPSAGQIAFLFELVEW